MNLKCFVDSGTHVTTIGRMPEEVWHGDVTAGVKRAWNVITADKYSFFHS